MRRYGFYIWRRKQIQLLSKRSQSEKATYCMIPVMCHSRKGKTMETIKDQWLPELSKEEGRNKGLAKNET